MQTILTCLVGTAITLLTLTSSNAQIVVNSLDDDGGGGDCELREAIVNANNDDQSGSSDCAAGSGTDTIDATGLSGTIVLNGSYLLVTSNMTIEGPGTDQLTVDGDDLSRIFSIGGASEVTIQDITMTRGSALFASAPDDNGGAILNRGTLNITRCVITGNHAPYGSGIHNANTAAPHSPSNGTLNIHDTEISHNVSSILVDGNGGGINNNSGGVLYITNSTISNNESNVGGGLINYHTATIINTTISGNISGSGGGIYTHPGFSPNKGLTLWHSTITDNYGGTGGGLHAAINGVPDTADVNLFSTIVARNTKHLWATGTDIEGSITNSQGYNIVGTNNNDGSIGLVDGVNGDQVGTDANPIDPMLFVLASNGGPTKTRMPIAGSPALDSGSCVMSSVILDQRSEKRPVDLPDADYPNADDGCDVGAVEAAGIELLKGIKLVTGVFLEGAYAGSEAMSLTLNAEVPTGQPYADILYNDTALDYDGLESVAGVPKDVVDWMLVSLRTGVDPETEVVTRPAFLNFEGEIVGLDSDTLRLPVSTGSYRVVVRHRNHLSVMSSEAVDFSTGTGTWDFRDDLKRAYTIGGTAMKALGDGFYAMFASDGNADGQTTAPDFNLWNAATTAGATGYEPSDYNTDTIVTAPDFNLWNANTTAGAASQVPD